MRVTIVTIGIASVLLGVLGVAIGLAQKPRQAPPNRLPPVAERGFRGSGEPGKSVAENAVYVATGSERGSVEPQGSNNFAAGRFVERAEPVQRAAAWFHDVPPPIDELQAEESPALASSIPQDVPPRRTVGETTARYSEMQPLRQNSESSFAAPTQPVPPENTDTSDAEPIIPAASVPSWRQRFAGWLTNAAMAGAAAPTAAGLTQTAFETSNDELYGTIDTQHDDAPSMLLVQDQPSTFDDLEQPEASTPVFEPQTLESSLFAQLGRGEARAEAAAAPSATGIDVSVQASAAIDTTQLTRQSSSATSISGIRRSQVAIQPVVRGYQQHQIYGQYQGANFIPVRFDFDSILSSIDPGIIDNLVIIPGPYGVKYGPGLAFIDVVPQATPRHDCPQWESRTTVLYQTNGEQFYGRETISGGGPNYGARITYGHKTGNDYQTGQDGQIPASYNVRDADAIFGFDFNDVSSIEFEYLRQDMTDTEFAGLTFDADIRKTDAFFFRYTNEDFAGASWLMEAWYNRTFFAGDNQRPSKLDFYRDNFFFAEPPDPDLPVCPPTSPAPDIGFIGFTDADVTNSGFRLSPTWQPHQDGPRFTAGVDFHFIEQELNEFDVFASRTFNFTQCNFDNFPVPRSDSIDPGVFAELEQPITRDFKVTTGARLDWFTTDAESRYRVPAPNGFLPPLYDPDENIVDTWEEVFGVHSLQQNDVLFSGFVSADLTITEEVDLKIGFGHGQRAPSLTERYSYLPFLTLVQSATNFPFGDPLLRPEKASQADISLTHNYEVARIRVSGFWSEIKDYIAFGTFLFPGDDEASVTFQNTDATIAGSELSMEFYVADSWTQFSSMSFVYGENEGKDEPLPSIYPLQSRIGIRYREPCEGRYGFEFTTRIVAGQDRVAVTLEEPTTVGFTVYDVRGYWQATERLRISSGIDNLTDKNYLEHLSVHDPAVLEPGFNFYTSMQLEY